MWTYRGGLGVLILEFLEVKFVDLAVRVAIELLWVSILFDAPSDGNYVIINRPLRVDTVAHGNRRSRLHAVPHTPLSEPNA
jgi:hypothetical protein